MPDGSKGNGNRIAERDYYEVERVERLAAAHIEAMAVQKIETVHVSGGFPCVNCELRFVEVRGDICRLCRHQIAVCQQQARQKQHVEQMKIQFAVCLVLTLIIWQIGFRLMGTSSLAMVGVCAFLALCLQQGLTWLCWRVGYWYQHERN